MPGKLLPKEAIILRVAQGTAKGCGFTYQLDTAMNGAPLVKSEKTGKTFALNWQELIEMAIDAGIDVEDNAG